jgi:iron complex outermembrane receptor protein
VGRQYLDNTTNKGKSINAYFVQDLRFQYTLTNKIASNIVLVAQMNNVWDKKYESNGYTYSYTYDQYLVQENFYYPMAGRSYMIGMNIKF